MSTQPPTAEIQILLEALVQCWEPAALRRLPAEDLRDPGLWDETVESRLNRLRALLGTQQYESRIHGLLLEQLAHHERNQTEREAECLAIFRQQLARDFLSAPPPS